MTVMALPDRKIVKRRRNLTLDGVAFTCVLSYHVAPDGSLFETGDLIDQNLVILQKAYQEKARQKKRNK
jgi:hypothetical protein